MKKIIAIFMTLVMTFAISTTAFAAENTAQANSNSNYEYIADLAAKTTVIEDETLTDSLTSMALNFIHNSTIKLHISESAYDFYNGKVALIADSNESRALVIPVNNDGYSSFSSLTVLFDDNNQVITYSELIVTKSANNTFSIQIFNDGVEAYNEVTDLEYISNDEMNDWIADVNEEYGGPQPYGLNVPCFVAVSGAGATVSGLIVKLCGAPCVLAPPACAVCLGGILVIGGGSIIAAVTQCWE